jgi:hypothetical protein
MTYLKGYLRVLALLVILKYWKVIPEVIMPILTAFTDGREVIGNCFRGY